MITYAIKNEKLQVGELNTEEVLNADMNPCYTITWVAQHRADVWG